MGNYRFDQYGAVYEYSKEQRAYIFVGKLNGRSKRQFIKDMEELGEF